MDDDAVSDFFNKDEEGTRIFVDENDNPVAFLGKDEAGNLAVSDFLIASYVIDACVLSLKECLALQALNSLERRSYILVQSTIRKANRNSFAV